MSETIYKKCDRNNYCAPLADRLQDVNDKVKGLSPIVLMNVKTGDTRTYGVVYRKSASDKGLMINFCPWCGVDIDQLSNRAKKENE